MSSSKIAQPGQGGAKSDQRKIYIDWANNKLRKSGFNNSFIHDLQKDTADGVKLPRIIQAVIQEEVPAVLSTVSNDTERRQNIEACVAFLQRKGVNCSGFTTKDVSEGSMRAILQLFFSLSQYKGKSSEGDHPPSKISRPTSPSLRMIHSVHSVNSSIQQPHSGTQQPHSGIQQPHSGTHANSHHISNLHSLPVSNNTSAKAQSNPTSPLSPPSANSSSGGSLSVPGGGSSSVHPSGSSLKSRPSQRRTAGSTIPTGMDFMAPRRVQYKNISLLQDDSKRNEEKDVSPTPSVMSKSDSNQPVSTGKQFQSSLQAPGTSGFKHPEGSGLKPHEGSGLRPPEKGPGLKPPEGFGLRPPEKGSGFKPPESSSIRPPESSGIRPPDSSGIRHPESSGIKPPESSGIRPPENSGIRPPENSGIKPPESSGIRPPESSGIRPHESSGIRLHEGAGIRPPGVLRSPNSSLSNLQSSFRSHNNPAEPKFETAQNGNSDSDKESQIASDSKLKTMTGNSKAQRSLSMNRCVTPGFGSSKLSKPSSSSSGLSESTTTSSSGGSSISDKSGIARPGGRLQPPGDHKHSPQLEKKETDSNEHTGLKPSEKSKLSEHKSGISGPSNTIPGPSTGLPGPSRIGGGRGGYQNVKLQNKDSEKTFGLPQHPGIKLPSKIDNSPEPERGLPQHSGIKLPSKINNSPEPERSSSVPKTTKLQQMTQLSRLKPAGSAPLRQASEPVIKTGSTESLKSDSSEDTEHKPRSKLAFITQKQSFSTTTTTTGIKPADSNIKELTEKTPEPVSANLEHEKSPESTTNSKPKLHPPPLDIVTASSETTPTHCTKADNRSSGSSIGSFTSSLNSQSESSILDVQTPSPLGGRKYVRRTSPEGMSVDETASPRDMNKLSDLSNESKEEVFSLMSSGEDIQGSNKDKENLLAIETGISSKIKRAQSLSPKASRRILPLQPQSVVTMRTAVSSGKTTGGGSLENVGKHGSVSKPVRSSLRTPRQPGDLKAGKHVKISPHSSVESFSSSDNSLIHINSMLDEKQDRIKRISQTERPKSLEDLESHSFSISGYPGDLHPHLLSNSLVRRGSTRSEKLDYTEESSFLQKNLSDEQRAENSTPELLETYENQLSTLKKDLESKAKMLNMYETSMADLSSKVHTLKRSLEEKDQAIKHLTEEKHRWNEFPFDQHSLAPSRLDAPALSDGGFSDGTPEYEREEQTTKKSNKKKGIIGRLRTKRNKSKENDLQQAEVSSIAGGSGNGKKKMGKTQPNDLMSISEYSTIEGKMPEFDTKSYIYDTRSEYGGYAPSIITEETGISMYEEEGDGTQVTVGLLTDNALVNNGGKLDTVVLGSLQIPQETSWVTMDSKICDIFKHHIDAVDPEGSLGITDESIFNYHIGIVSRAIGNALLPHSTPYQSLVDSTEISITLKGTAQESCDALAYCLLINASQLHSYIAMLLETQWIVVMGTKGTCKSTLAEGLASYLELLVKEEQTVEDEIGLIGNEDDPLVTRFSIASGIGSGGDGLDNAMRFIKHELPHKINRSSRTPILLFDNVYDCQTIEQLISAAGSLSKRPYIISTLCSGGTTRGVPLHQLMFRHNIRVVTCSPTDEPIYGILTRTLRKRLYRLKADDNVEREAEILVNWLPSLLDHLNYFINKFHSNNVALGPRVFMNCSLEISSVDMEVWFINLWNHFIIPYLMGTIMAGIETYSADPNLLWIDVREWVIETYPWQQSQNISKLKTLNPEDVGWNHAVRPQQGRFMYMKDDDTQSVLRMKGAEMAI